MARFASKAPVQDKGSTFILTLPLAAVAHAHPDPAESRAHPRIPSADSPTSISPDLTGISILVVDDDPDARDVMRHILCTGGATVTTASTAAQALELIQQSPPSLLISDIGMPGKKTGMTLSEKSATFPPPPAAKLPPSHSPHSRAPEDRQRALRSGYQLHVAKPVEPSELLTVCASLAGRVG